MKIRGLLVRGKLCLVMCLCIILAIGSVTVYATELAHAHHAEDGFDEDTYDYYSGGTLGCSVSCYGKTSWHSAWVHGDRYDYIAGTTVQAEDDDGLLDTAVLVTDTLIYTGYYDHFSNILFDKDYADTYIYH